MDAPCITMQFQRFHKRLYGLYKNNVPKSTIFSNLNGVTKSGFGITFQNMTCSQKHPAYSNDHYVREFNHSLKKNLLNCLKSILKEKIICKYDSETSVPNVKRIQNTNP